MEREEMAAKCRAALSDRFPGKWRVATQIVEYTDGTEGIDWLLVVTKPNGDCEKGYNHMITTAPDITLDHVYLRLFYCAKVLIERAYEEGLFQRPSPKPA